MQREMVALWESEAEQNPERAAAEAGRAGSGAAGDRRLLATERLQPSRLLAIA